MLKPHSLTRILLVIATCATATAAAQSPDLLSEGQAWWAHVQFLADDALEGRNVGTPGYEKAVDYVESQFKAIGLKPAGTSGFRQPVKFDSRKLAADQSQLVLVRDGKEESLTIGQDGSLNARGELNGSKEASMVFIGYGLSMPDAGWDDLKGVDVRGKIAVYVNAFAPVKVSDNVKSHANTADERWAAVKRAGAIGIASIPPPTPPPPTVTAPPAAAAGPPPPPQPVITLSDRDVQNLSGQIVSLNFTARGAEKLFAGSGHTFAEITQLVKDGKPLPTFAMPGTIKMRAALTRDTFEAANIAALFEGSDPALKNEYVVMTSHLDHVGIGRAVNGDTIYNGAMDDASGIAAMLQIARMLKTSGATTKRSILFVAVSAEERGLLGSRYFAAHPTVPARQSFVVNNFFADLKRHDLGNNFAERNFDGTFQRQFMTEPLWGVGTTAPYGHDGRSQSLEEVILRHGGEAQAARDSFNGQSRANKNLVLGFLASLVLFPPDDTASNTANINPAASNFPQNGHGAIALTPLFNNPADIE